MKGTCGWNSWNRTLLSGQRRLPRRRRWSRRRMPSWKAAGMPMETSVAHRPSTSEITTANSSNDYNTYLKFDLSKTSGTITSAVLELTPLAGYVTSTTTIGVADTGNNWTEGTVTWNNAPAATGTPVTVSAAQLARTLRSQSMSRNSSASRRAAVKQPTSSSTCSCPSGAPTFKLRGWTSRREYQMGPWTNAGWLPTLVLTTSSTPVNPPAPLSVSASVLAPPPPPTAQPRLRFRKRCRRPQGQYQLRVEAHLSGRAPRDRQGGPELQHCGREPPRHFRLRGHLHLSSQRHRFHHQRRRHRQR